MKYLIEEYKKIKELEKKIKELEKEKIKYMTNDEMRYIRQKCIDNRSLTTNELFRYSKAFEISEKIMNLKLELSDQKETMKNNYEKTKEILKEIIKEMKRS